MTIREAIQKATIQLKTKNVEAPKLKARLLIQFVLKKDRQYIMVYDEQKLTKEQEEQYFKKIEKLIKGIPLQHITHQQEFMRMNFYVNEDVLIPRPDTECLVEEVIRNCKKNKCKKDIRFMHRQWSNCHIPAKYIENSQITATDISQKALEIAEINAKYNGVDNKIAFLYSDLLKDIPKEKYDIIVSNPPYIKREIIKTLNKEVQKEPIIALDGGWDGLDFYRKFAKQIRSHLNRKISHQADEFLKYGGYLCLEIGYDQKEDVIDIIEHEQKYVDTYCKKDLYDNDRVIATKIM